MCPMSLPVTMGPQTRLYKQHRTETVFITSVVTRFTEKCVNYVC